MEERPVRIVDIAEELGLSTATVSNVIHGKTKKISDETVKRVQELLEKKHYIPNMAGILLAQNDSKIIGVVINKHEKYEGCVLQDTFISSSLNYLSEEIEQAGYFMMIKTTDQWSEIAGFASMWNMEGLIAIGFCEQNYKKLKEFMHIPFVVYDGYFEEQGRLANLIIDNYDGGYQVGRYFQKMGHSRVLCVSDNRVCMDEQRYQGFKAGVTTGQASFMLIPMEKEKRREFYEKNLKKIRENSAVFAVSDYYAVDLMNFLQEKNISVPEEISIAGFDDSPICEMVYPAITTVRQDGKKRAELAISILRDLRIENSQGSTITLPVDLVERQSVKKV